MSRSTSRPWPLFLALALAALTRTGSTAEAPPPVRDLSTLFKVGLVVEDRNGDSFADFANVRLVLPPSPTEGQIAAAANIAARVGLETTAMDIPVKRGADGPEVAISIATATGPDALALGPDEGLVRFMPGAPSSLLVTGKTDAGTMSAAAYVAARLPFAWDVKGATLEKVEADIREALKPAGVIPTDVSINEVLVGSDGVSRLVASVKVGSGAELVKARAAMTAIAARLPGLKTPPPLSYRGVTSLRVALASGAAHATVDIKGAAKPARPQPIARRASGAKDGLDLSTIYSIDGGLGDSDNNLIPDRTDVMISAVGEGTEGVIDLAARIGLESTGISVPLVVPADSIDATTPPRAPEGSPSPEADNDKDRPEALPMLILIGAKHPVVERLIRDKKFELPALAPGEGLIHVVKNAFGGLPGQGKPAIVVAGGDAAGVARAIAQLAETFPHIAARGKDRTTVDDIEEDVRKFVQARSPEGQAATALYKLDRLVTSLQGRDLASARVKVFIEKAEPGLDALVRRRVGTKLGGTLEVTVESLDVQKAPPIVVAGSPVAGEMDIASEVDEFWKTFRAQVLPAVQNQKSKKPKVEIEARLSEPPAVRAAIEKQVRAELVAAGAPDAGLSVSVLSAYKQGYSWLIDSVMPRLAGKPIDTVTLKFAEIGPPPEWKTQTVFAPTRWLLESYPFADVMARDLKLDLKQIVIEKMPIGSPAYEVSVKAKDGSSILNERFEPKWVLRSMFDRIPDYEKTRVTTGWIEATVSGVKVADARVVTDYERFWDIFQSQILGRLYDHVMAVHKGKPKPEDAPYFGEMRVDLTLSEPDYRLGIDEEQISATEMLHEEIYFNTIHFFDVLGRYARGPSLNYIGRIIPTIRSKADGKPGHLKYSVTGFTEPRPTVAVDYVEKGGRVGSVHLDVTEVATERPSAYSTRVIAGQPGLASLDLRVKVDSEKNERDDLVKRTSEDRVDRTMISAEQVTAALTNLESLRAAGLYKSALAYHDVGVLRLGAHWEHAATAATERVAALQPNGAPEAWPDIRQFLPAGYKYSGGTMVQWDEPISPGEGAELLAKMSTFPEVTVYKAGESYLGKDIWAMDILPKVDSSHLSAAKQTTVKPTVVYSARQHANEVSSTSHVLRMAELLLTDPAYKEKLKKVNVVVHPFTNIDGAQLAYDLQKITPYQMLHAGYLGSLGVDVTSAQNDPDPMYPETLVRPKLWRAWLPDIFLNPHGYPTHEWVQAFSEYAAWVRTRAVETRDYWTMRGWWMPGFSWLDDPRYPRHKTEQMKLLSMITANVKAAPEVWALNQRAYDRYTRYSFAFDEKNFKLDFTDGVLTYKAIKGSRAAAGPAGGGGVAQGSGAQPGGWMQRYPNITLYEGSTEAPDETAHGDWMKLVATAGLQWDKASFEYLAQGNHKVDRRADPFFGGGVSLSMNRTRPARPAEAATPKP
ncbi:MAG: M14 family metallopeptidase [Vicinamibacteria bacterium]